MSGICYLLNYSQIFTFVTIFNKKFLKYILVFTIAREILEQSGIGFYNQMNLLDIFFIRAGICIGTMRATINETGFRIVAFDMIFSKFNSNLLWKNLLDIRKYHLML